MRFGDIENKGRDIHWSINIALSGKHPLLMLHNENQTQDEAKTVNLATSIDVSLRHEVVNNSQAGMLWKTLSEREGVKR